MPGRKRGTGNQHSQPSRNSLSSELRKLTQLGPQPPGIEHPTPRPPVTHFTTREICSKEKPEQKVLQFAGCVRDVSCCCDQIPVRKQRKRGRVCWRLRPEGTVPPGVEQLEATAAAMCRHLLESQRTGKQREPGAGAGCTVTLKGLPTPPAPPCLLKTL